MDYHTVGLLPTLCMASFADACAGLFSAPEVERDLLKVSNSSLIEAVKFHAASISGWMFDFFLCISPGGSLL